MRQSIIILTMFLMTVLSVRVSLAAMYQDEAGQKWQEQKEEHFIIYYKSAPKDFVNEVADTAEKYYREIASNLGFTRYQGWLWDDRAKIFIYDGPEDYMQSGMAYGWSHGVASPQSRIIRTFPSAHGFFDSTLPHELGHIIFREFIGFKAQIPLWFEEGVAMYQEKAKRWGAHDVVRKAIKGGSYIPLQQLSNLPLNANSSQETVDLFYAESASAVNYLINDQGQHKFVRFCRKISEGGSFESALASVYVRFTNLEKLNNAWVNYLKQ